MPDDAESFLGVKAQPPAGGDPPLEIVSDSPYRGYGGWLRFFCIVQIFIAPPIALISVAVSMSAIGEVANRFPSLVFPTVLETIGNLGMIGFGVYAGIALRRVQLGAVRVAVLTCLIF